ncbi:branched-chain amino acid ABC transporter permease [Qaidamihabitans albus]|uniref:branched-chain amino acid ABC transporter permease n=1 Tax=Qaidamihabitans albus TaxID=2795733 RepID=UPI0018F1898B|nr:branched-chain amino acid ABC transporter permease [Qaidamihabitans albus]
MSAPADIAAPAEGEPRKPPPVRVLVSVLAAVLLAAAPLFLAPYAISTLTRMLVFGLLAASLALLVGVSGLPSLGHAAYFGAGAYAAGWFAQNVSAQAPLSLLVAAFTGGFVAAATGWIAVRARGVFFLMLTLAIGEIVHQVADSWESVTGGSNGLYGIPATEVGGAAITNVGVLHWYVLAAFGGGFAVLWAVKASPFGAALRGIHDNEPRMRSIGYPTSLYKYAVFVVAGTVAGLAGGLLAAQQRLVTPADLGFTTAALALLAVIIGGARSLWGACLGAALVIFVRDSIGPSLDGHGPLLLGVVFILVVYLMPNGVAGIRIGRGKGGGKP